MNPRAFFIGRLARLFAADPLPLRLVFWDGESFDLAARPEVTITLRSPSLMWLLLTGRIGRLGDAYVGGLLTVEGAVEDVLAVGIRLAERLGTLPGVAAFAHLPRPHFRHSKQRDAAAIRHHYAVSNDFYALWLDRSLTYSCAYFETGEEDIDTAQRQKMHHICNKLRLRPGERLLDIGCGWGGFLIEAAKHYGVTGLGITNSDAQYSFARDAIAREGLADRIAVRLCDYRDIEDEPFDKIVSVGMYEHVGKANLPVYFGKVAALLKPGGAFLNHGIVATNPNGEAQGPPGGEFIDRHVFPGGELPSLPQALSAIAQAGLEAVDVEDLRPHYARTLLLWVRRLEAVEAEAIRAASAERYRVWRIYLAGMALAFDRGWLSVCQTLSYRPRGEHPASRPWSRAYQYESGSKPAIAQGLDWSL